MVLIFLHIPKTGGSSLLWILQRHYRLEEVFHDTVFQKAGDCFLNDKKFLHGHFKYGIHELLKLRNYKYISLLRNPVYRVFSHYFYAREQMFMNDREFRDQDLVSWLEKNKSWVSNLQTAYISGEDHVDLKALRKAKDNLKKDFLFIGITELFDESLLILRKLLGLKDIYYGLPRNATQFKHLMERANEDLFLEVERVNRYDMELYEYAKDLLMEHIKNYGSDFSRDLEEFRKRNRGKEGILAHALDVGLREVRRGRVIALFRIAQVFAMRGEREKALAICDRARRLGWGLITMEPDFIYLEAGVYRLLRIFKKAEELYIGLAKDEGIDTPIRGKSYYYLGEIYLEEGKREEALEAFKSCLELYPGHAKAYIRLKELDL
ncbi:MAG: sulfotransferase family 2 domain-containing protein [Synergistetes bacterium]|nr:sulfotransferase family 2 domain-containing protein [Synergistota bacterium]